MECTNSFDTFKSHDGESSACSNRSNEIFTFPFFTTQLRENSLKSISFFVYFHYSSEASFIEMPNDECSKQQCYCYDHYHDSIDSTDSTGVIIPFLCLKIQFL